MQALKLMMSKTAYLKNIIIFSFIMLSLGFIFGTFTLGLLVKSVIISIRQTGWLADYEKIVVIAIVSAYVLFILLFAKWTTLWLQTAKDVTTVAVFFIILIILTYVSVHYWLKPVKSPFTKPLLSKDHRFLAGPYPDKDLLSQLKTQGYTTVISLLDPLVLPNEAYILHQETKTVEAMGMKLINVPLMPANIESPGANKQIETIAMSNSGMKYYVHSNDQQRIATFMQVANKFKRSVQDIQTGIITNRYNTISLERGTAIQLDQHVIVSPKPTNEELLRYFVTTPNNTVKIPIRTIISMNPDDTNDQTNDFAALLKAHGINYLVMPIQLYPYDPQSVLTIVNQIKTLSDSVLVYSYYMPPQSEVMSAFIMSYLTNLPAIPKILFSNEKMQGGTAKILAPNVVIGPQPDSSEFSGYLKTRGIHNVGFIGPCSGVEYNRDMNLATMAGLEWICLQAKDVNMYQVLVNGGPWYVYGPDLPTVSTELTQRLSVLIPDHALLGE